MSVQLRAGLNAAQQLAATPAGAPVAAQLIDVYTKLGVVIDSTSNLSPDEPGGLAKGCDRRGRPGRAAAADRRRARGPPRHPERRPVGESARVRSAERVGRAVPVAVGGPEPVRGPVAPPPRRRRPSPSATTLPPVSPSPSPGPNGLLNPGFEDPTLAPWSLVLTGPASATPAVDPVNPFSGKLSARIDIAEPRTSQLWISFQQKGLTIESGAVYRVQLSARSATPRRSASGSPAPTGNLLGSGAHDFSIGPDWTSLTFEMSSFLRER